MTQPPRPTDLDLDRLIGELEGEAARRRAEPAFPNPADGRLRRELDELSPGHGPAARRLVDAVMDIGRASAATARPSWRDRLPVPGIGPDRHLTELADAVAAALEVLFDRTDPPRRGPMPAPLRPAPVDPLTVWWADLRDRARPARVICGGTGGGELARELSEAGHNVDWPAGRGEDLGGVLADAETPAALVVAGAVPAEAAAFQELVEVAGARATTVEVVSAAPWAWRRGRSVAEAELSVDRPLPAELWIELLSGVGFTTTARYDAAGTTYEVVAGRPPRP